MNWYGFNVRAHPDNTDSIFVCLFGCLLKTMKTKLYQHWQRKRNEMISNYVYYENISFNIFIQKYFYQQKKYFYFHRKMSKSIDYTQTKSRHREKNFFCYFAIETNLLYSEQRAILSTRIKRTIILYYINKEEVLHRQPFSWESLLSGTNSREDFWNLKLYVKDQSLSILICTYYLLLT